MGTSLRPFLPCSPPIFQFGQQAPNAMRCTLHGYKHVFVSQHQWAHPRDTTLKYNYYALAHCIESTWVFNEGGYVLPDTFYSLRVPLADILLLPQRDY